MKRVLVVRVARLMFDRLGWVDEDEQGGDVGYGIPKLDIYGWSKGTAP